MQPQIVWRGSIPVVETPVDRRPETPVVLVVTSDADLRDVAARVLGREGYTVVTAAHAGHAVLACLKAGRVDVLVAELSMEDVSGPALAARLRRHCPEMETVYVARAGTPECEGMLVRPFTRDDLLVIVALRLAASAVTA
ncbi:MAG: response regulator [Acidobacteria bacterium]|nr:response regulator [Acidobacteriota bacterium]